MRVLAGTDATVRLHLRDGDGEPVTPGTGPAVDVVDSGGDPVAGSPFSSTVDTSGVVEFVLPAAVTGTLDRYTASASATVDGATAVGTAAVETVGGFLFSIAELREREPTFDDQSVYPLTLLRRVRDAAEIRFERGARRAFVPRARRVTRHVDRSGLVPLTDIDITEIVAATHDGDAITVADLELTGGTYGAVRWDAATWAYGDAVDLLYLYGLEGPPAPVAEAAMRLAREIAVTSSLPSRATAMTSEIGTFRLTIPGRDGPTGIPDVDAVMVDFGRPEGAVG